MKHEKFFRQLLENVYAAIVVHDSKRTIRVTNRAAQKLLGFSEEYMHDKRIEDLPVTFLRRDSSIMPTSEYPVNQAFSEGKKLRGLIAGIRRQDCEDILWLLINADPIFDTSGVVIEVVETFADISIGTRAELALRRSEERYIRITNAVTDYIYTVRMKNGKPVETTHGPACVAVTGYSSEDFKKNPYLWIEMVHPEDVVAVEQLGRRAQSGEKVESLEHRIIRKDGAIRWIRNTPVLHFGSNGKLIAYDGLIQDVTERKLAEAALRESEERFRTITETARDAIFMKGRDLRYILVNPSTERLCRMPQAQILGRTDDELFGKEFVAHSRQIDLRVLGGEVVEEENTRKIDGIPTTFHVIKVPVKDSLGQVTGLCGIARDVTEKQRLETQLQQIQKMEAIGTLAGGIAHDFNNLMSVVLGNVSLARELALDRPRVATMLNNAEAATLRAKELTYRLLTFSKGGAPLKKVGTIAKVIQEAVELALAGSNVGLTLTIPNDLWPVEFDEDQIRLALTNIVTNAEEAMAAQGGHVRVRCENLTMFEGVQEEIPLPAGRYIKITIEDDGIGIPDEYRHMVFDPYFSTKERGANKGMGLGLTTAYSVIRRHNGLLSLKSKLGEGTTCYIYLPVAAQTGTQAEGKYVIPSRQVAETGRILVMDDEEMIRALSLLLIGHLGYSAEAAQNGTEAIQIYQKALDAGRPFDAVILDLTVKGGLGGVETLKQLKDLDPNVKAVVSSGYANDPVLASYLAYGFCDVLTKPYGIEELKTVLGGLISNATLQSP